MIWYALSSIAAKNVRFLDESQFITPANQTRVVTSMTYCATVFVSPLLSLSLISAFLALRMLTLNAAGLVERTSMTAKSEERLLLQLTRLIQAPRRGAPIRPVS